MPAGEDLQAVVDGVKLVRRMTAGMKPDLIVTRRISRATT